MPAVQETSRRFAGSTLTSISMASLRMSSSKGPRRGFAKIPSVSFRRRRASRSGCSGGVWTPIGVGSPCGSRPGRASTTGRSTIRTSITMPRRRGSRAPSRWTKYPEILATYEKLGIPLREREALLGIQKPEGENGYGRVAVDAVFELWFRWRPPSRRSLPRPGSCSCRSRRPWPNIRTW